MSTDWDEIVGISFVYWILPSVLLLIMIAMYFSGQPVLMSIVAPQFNRELGLLESVQHLMLLAISLMLFARIRHARESKEKLLFGVLLAGAVFLLLEELNYGTHYWYAITGQDWETKPIMSVHNQGDLSDIFKDTGDAVLLIFFVGFALLGGKLENKWAEYFRPQKMFVVSIICAILVSRVAHYLNQHYPPANNYFVQNMGEFREMFVYYIGLVYCWILCRNRKWPASDP